MQRAATAHSAARVATASEKKAGGAGRPEAQKSHPSGPVRGAKKRRPVISVSHPLSTLKDLAQQALAEKKGSFLSVVADEKGALSTAGAERGMAREYARTLLGSRPFRVQVVQEIAAVSVGANTAMSVSSPMNFVAATEFSSWAALFDEVRCLSYRVRQLVQATQSAAIAGGQAWAAAISPAINTAPSSLVQTIGFTRFVGPVPAVLTQGGAGGTATALATVLPVSNHGLPELASGPLVKGVLTNNSGGTMTVNPVQGDWVPTGTNSAHAGYHLLYGDALGSTNTWTYRLWVWYLLEFRSRSG